MTRRSPFDLSGRCAVVTGASSGIGQAISRALAGAGADIVGLSLDDGAETNALVTTWAGAAFNSAAIRACPLTSNELPPLQPSVRSARHLGQQRSPRMHRAT